MRKHTKRTFVLLLAVVFTLSCFSDFAFAGDGYTTEAKEARAEQNTNPLDLGYVPDQILVVYDDSVSDRSIEASTDTIGEVKSSEDITKDEKLATIDISNRYTVDTAVKMAEKNPKVLYAQPNYVYTPAYVAESLNDKEAPDQYYLDAVNAGKAWDYAKTSGYSKTRIAVIDTGADVNHEDLSGVINRSLSVKMDWDGSTTPLTKDSAEHGTHVCGIIAAQANNGKGIAGVASIRNNSLVDLMVVDPSVGGTFFMTSVMAQAIKYSVDSGAKVLSMSITGGADTTEDSMDFLYEDAIKDATSRGTTVICAAGNNSLDTTMYPSDSETAISVIAVDQQNNKADFSNYGGATTRVNKLSAPGTGIVSSIPGNQYASWDGTSMATPIVSAIAAMMYSVNPSLSSEQVKSLLFSTSTDIGAKGYDNLTGYGIVNAYAAVKGADDFNTSSNPTSVTLNKAATSVKVGGEETLSATVNPVGTVKWTSSDKAIATVNSSGTVTGVMGGTATITATTSNGIKGSCQVTVTEGSQRLAAPAIDLSTKQDTLALSWGSVEHATGYALYRSKTVDGNYRYVTTVDNPYYEDHLSRDNYDSSYTIYCYDTVYYYKVKAIGDGDNYRTSQFSDAIAAYEAPVNSSVLMFDYLDETTVGVSWWGNGWCSLYRKSGSGEYVLLQEYLPNESIIIYYDESVTPGTNYTYKVDYYNVFDQLREPVSSSAEYSYKQPSISYDSSMGAPKVNGFTSQGPNSDYEANLYLSWINATKNSKMGVEVLYTSDNWANTQVFRIPPNAEGVINDAYEIRMDDSKTYKVKMRYYTEVTVPGEIMATVTDSITYGGWSNEITATSLTSLARPNLYCKVVSSNSATLSWDAVPGAKYYSVQRSTSATGGYNGIGSGSITGTTYTDTSLSSGKIYYYRVMAIGGKAKVSSSVSGVNLDSAEICSRPSNSVIVRTSSVQKVTPKKVTGVKATSVSRSYVNLSWSKQSAATKYKVSKYSSSGKYLGCKYTNANSISYTGLSKSTTYAFKVRAYVGTSYGTYSDYCKAKTTPKTLSGLKVLSKSRTSVKLGWSAQKGITGYKVYKYSSGKYKLYKTLKGYTSTSKTISSLRKGTKYKFKVVSYYSTSKKTYYGGNTYISVTTSK